MTAFFYHLAYDFRTGVRDRSQLLMNYLFPLFFYLMMGVIMTKINPGFKDYMIPGMIMFTALTATVLSMPNPIVAAREGGIFRSYRINGVPAINILTVPMLGSIAHLTVASAIILFSAGPLFGAKTPDPSTALAGIGIFLAIAFCLASLGVLIAIVSPNSRMTILFSQLIYLPSIMLSGVMMPLSVLPESMMHVSMLLPTTYAMEAFRGKVWQLPAAVDPLVAVLVLLAGGVAALGMSVYLFQWDSKNTGRRRSPYLALLAMLPYAAAAILIK
jgi:ABC-2 type transport system permease protein